MLGTATTTLVAFAITLSLPVAAAVGGVEFVVKSAYDVVMGWRAETRRREEAAVPDWPDGTARISDRAKLIARS